MEFALKLSAALVGLFLLRGLLYPRGWRRRTVANLLFVPIGVALTLPLATLSRTGLFTLFIVAALALFPYRRLAVAYLEARTRSGLHQLAERWGSRLVEDPRSGGWEVRGRVDGLNVWVVSVLTRHGSLDPSVRRSRVDYMLAFGAELDTPPPFLCSLMLGWERPRYFEREWRETHVIQGEYLSLAFGELGLEEGKGRSTGGRVDELEPYPQRPPGLPESMTVLVNRPDPFARCFEGELDAALAAAASRSFPFELNVTPTSVNVYTTYCDAEAQRAHMALVLGLARRLRSAS